MKGKIARYIDSLENQKDDLGFLHSLISKSFPKSKLWFLDGKNDEGKIIANPNLGYGSTLIKYADGTSKEFYRLGISAKKTGFSIYVMGLGNKNLLKEKFEGRIGKAKVTGYCINFTSLKVVELKVLEELVCWALTSND